MIYNLLGQPILNFTIYTESFKVNTSNLAKGQHILFIQDKTGLTTITKNINFKIN
jgi:hypothetical protein